MINPNARVSFDLAGDGIARQWPWVKPGTALLVWDPLNTGEITTGRALFGSRTWWVFFRDGYEALSVLDDNRDGRLAGDELHGIGVWTDLNGNALSDAGEVKPAAQHGIATIAVTATRDAHGTLTSEAGIRFIGGQSVRTFDWVTEPAGKESLHP